jgi:hypothetical protein
VRAGLVTLLLSIVASLCVAQQVNRVGHRASAASGAEQGRHVPASGLPASTALAIEDGLKRIAAAQEAQAASGKTDAEKKREADDLQAQQDMASWAKAMFIATIVSACVSVFATWLLFLTLKQSRAATRAAMRAAAAGRQSVRLSRDSAEKQLRAYVSIIDAKAKWLEDEDDVTHKVLHIKVDFRNTGQTPAHGVRSWALAKSMSTNNPSFVLEDDPESTDGAGKATQGPGQLNSIAFFKTFKNDSGVMLSWKLGSQSLFVFGKLEYTDVFGVHRRTSFRLVMPPQGIGSKRGAFQTCADGNDAT